MYARRMREEQAKILIPVSAKKRKESKTESELMFQGAPRRGHFLWLALATLSGAH